jgi:hypothetical protein
MKRHLWILFLALPIYAEEVPFHVKATYPEIPYYLKQLQETELEGKRVEYNKIIHEAVVSSDLSDPRVVKKMEPIVQKIQMAADSGLDRPYLSGSSMWLNTAIEYFEREKLRRLIELPQSEWMKDQSESQSGLRITTLPEKITLFDGKNNKTVVESANIFEAVISPNGKYVAFSRKTNEETKAEIWVVDLKKLKRKKIASVKSCRTLLFSMNGNTLFFQEEPSSKEDVPLYAISRSGGKPKMLTKVRLLETLVGSGPYQGNLIAYKAVIHHLGTTSQDCAFVLKENGREVGKIKGGPCR